MDIEGPYMLKNYKGKWLNGIKPTSCRKFWRGVIIAHVKFYGF